MNELVLITARTTSPAIIAAAGGRASLRFLEFFAANIRNPNTRRAYSRAVAERVYMLITHRPGPGPDYGAISFEGAQVMAAL